MTNLEFYKDKIKDYCNHDELTPAVMSVMSDNGVAYYEYDDSDDSDILVLNWLCEEYKDSESILTSKEKEYLHNLMHWYDFEDVVFGTHILTIKREEINFRLDLIKPIDLFKELNEGTYTLEELDLWPHD